MAETQPLLRKKSMLNGKLALTTLVTCLGSIQYGYHIAELNAPQQVLSCAKEKIPWFDVPFRHTWLGRHGFSECIPLTEEEIGLATSIFSIGGLLGSLYAGRLADQYGRKRFTYATCALGALGSAVLFQANSFWELVAGRCIVGISCGSAIVVTPLFINEISPNALRGSLGSMNQVCINVGILLTQTLALWWADSYRWRWLLFAGVVIALVNIALLSMIGESPIWLASRGDLESADSILCELRGGDMVQSRLEIDQWLTARGTSREDTLRVIHASGSSSTRRSYPPASNASSQSQPSDESLSLFEYFKDSRFTESRRAITMILMGQQFCGINSIVFYGVKVISGSLPDQAITVNFAISLMNVIVTFGASFFIDRWGRRPLLMLSTAAMTISTVLISVGIIESNAVLLVAFTLTYVAFFAMGLGPIPFLVISELSPHAVAGVAQSYGVACNWIATFAVGYSFPILHSFMQGYVFLVFAVVSAAFATYVYYYIPETKGKSYKDVWTGRYRSA
ncbi:LAMI_0F08042g1_1 [Lachancea mirantina]|uniref:LAMI_0F08042g1_1 n=1 Tax=Lachancea mirantina TaxID=1230905 RepID=A0A1G4K049_9SACH|nr:LAMI_0F08042g1_1 [Lachancea mirantina]